MKWLSALSPWLMIIIAVAVVLMVYFIIRPRINIEGFESADKTLSNYYGGNRAVKHVHNNVYFDPVNGNLISDEGTGLKLMTRNGDNIEMTPSVEYSSVMISKSTPTFYKFNALKKDKPVSATSEGTENKESIQYMYAQETQQGGCCRGKELGGGIHTKEKGRPGQLECQRKCDENGDCTHYSYAQEHGWCSMCNGCDINKSNLMDWPKNLEYTSYKKGGVAADVKYGDTLDLEMFFAGDEPREKVPLVKIIDPADPDSTSPIPVSSWVMFVNATDSKKVLYTNHKTRKLGMAELTTLTDSDDIVKLLMRPEVNGDGTYKGKGETFKIGDMMSLTYDKGVWNGCGYWGCRVLNPTTGFFSHGGKDIASVPKVLLRSDKKSTPKNIDATAVMYAAVGKSTFLHVFEGKLEDDVTSAKFVKTMAFKSIPQEKDCKFQGKPSQCIEAPNCASGWGRKVGDQMECCDCPELVSMNTTMYNQTIDMSKTDNSNANKTYAISNLTKTHTGVEAMNDRFAYVPETGSVLYVNDDDTLVSIDPNGNEANTDKKLSHIETHSWYKVIDQNVVVYNHYMDNVNIYVIHKKNGVSIVSRIFPVKSETPYVAEKDDRSPQEKLTDRLMKHVGDLVIKNLDDALTETPAVNNTELPSDDYILKTQIVPPVCPQCPNCSGCAGVCTTCGGNGGSGMVDKNGESMAKGEAANEEVKEQSKKRGNIAEQAINEAGDTVSTAVGKTDEVIKETTGVGIKDVGAAGKRGVKVAGSVVGDVYGGVKTVITDIYSGIKGLGNRSAPSNAMTAPTTTPMTAPQTNVLTNTDSGATQRTQYFGKQVSQGVDNRFGAVPDKGENNFLPITSDFSAFGR